MNVFADFHRNLRDSLNGKLDCETTYTYAKSGMQHKNNTVQSQLFVADLLYFNVWLIDHHLRACPLYRGFPSPKTKFHYLSLSLVSSSVSPWFVMLRLTPTIHLSLGLPLLRVPSGCHLI
jgi:hypothetical protein